MFKHTIMYTDYDGVDREETAYFNLNAVEMMRIQNTTPGGYGAYLERVSKSKDSMEIWNTFETIVSMSYGMKSPDGTKFVKEIDGHKVVDDWKASPAYEAFMMELLTNDTLAADFVNGIIPQKMIAKLSGSSADAPAAALA